MVMVINLSNSPINLLLQWRHIPSLRNSPTKYFRFREVTQGDGWEGYSSIGIGISDVAPHGSFVVIVSEGLEEGDNALTAGKDIVQCKFHVL